MSFVHCFPKWYVLVICMYFGWDTRLCRFLMRRLFRMRKHEILKTNSLRKPRPRCSDHQARNQWGAQGGEVPLEKFSPLLEKCVGHSLKLLDAVQKIWAPLRKLFVASDIPSKLVTGLPTTLPTWSRGCRPHFQPGHGPADHTSNLVTGLPTTLPTWSRACRPHFQPGHGPADHTSNRFTKHLKHLGNTRGVAKQQCKNKYFAGSVIAALRGAAEESRSARI